MTREITTIQELMAELESGNYNYYGLRGAYESDLEKLDRGYLDRSYVWEDGEQTDEQLDGTCALGVSDSLTEDEIQEVYDNGIDMFFNTELFLED